MAADLGKAELEFRARLDKLDADMSQAKSKVSRATDDMGDDVHRRLGSKLSGIGGTLGKSLALGVAGAAAGVAVGVGALLKGAFDAAEESRKVGAQTAAVIQSTGGAANVSAGHVGKYADQLAALTGTDDELIASGQNMLLTFTKVRNEAGKGNDIFDQGTKAALNMSVALGKDLPGSAMLVGKALNDPIAGMTALTRSGIQFTAQQKDQIKAMVAAGDTLGAQKVILKELETQFGGSAEAAASPMARLKVVVGNLQEELGARLLPVVGKVATFLADKLPGAIDKVSGLFGGLFSLFAKGDFTGQLGKALGVEEDSPIIAKLFAIRDKIAMAFAQVKAIVYDFVVAFKLALSGESFEAMTGPQRAAQVIVDVMRTIVAVVRGAVDIVTTLWNQFGEQIMTYTRNAWDAAMTIVGGAMEMIRGIVATVTAIIHGDWSAAWEGIKDILSGAFHAILGFAAQWDNMMRTLMSVAMEILTSIIKSAFEGIVNFVASIPGRILDALGNLGSLLYQAGRDLIMGMLNGIKSMAGALADAAKSVASGAVNAVKGFLGIGSPSKLFMGFGVNVGQGLAIGMERSVGLVAGAGDVLASAAGGYGASLSMSSMGHSGSADSDGSSSGGRPINVGPFYVKENDLPTEIPRRLRGALHLWDR